MKHRFVLVDVFADRPLAGNPLAVFPEADEIPADRLQAIAREMDHAATAFVFRPSQSGAAFRLRIFSREREIPFAGHPAIGAHFVHATERGLSPEGGGIRVAHEGAEGLFEVAISSEEAGTVFLRLRQRLPEMGSRLSEEEVARLAPALGLSEEEILATNQPVRVVSIGIAVLIVPVVTLEALGRARPARTALGLLEERSASLVYAFTKETRDARAAAHARAFDLFAASEIPGAGAAAGALAAYLVSEAAVPVLPVTVLRIEQGHVVSRPSTLIAEVRVRDGAITDVIVGGRVIRVGEGYLEIES